MSRLLSLPDMSRLLGALACIPCVQVVSVTPGPGLLTICPGYVSVTLGPSLLKICLGYYISHLCLVTLGRVVLKIRLGYICPVYVSVTPGPGLHTMCPGCLSYSGPWPADYLSRLCLGYSGP